MVRYERTSPVARNACNLRLNWRGSSCARSSPVRSCGPALPWAGSAFMG